MYPTIPPNYIRVRAVVWECGEGQTDTRTAVTNIHFALAVPHAKYNDLEIDTHVPIQWPLFGNSLVKPAPERILMKRDDGVAVASTGA